MLHLQVLILDVAFIAICRDIVPADVEQRADAAERADFACKQVDDAQPFAGVQIGPGDDGAVDRYGTAEIGIYRVGGGWDRVPAQVRTLSLGERRGRIWSERRSLSDRQRAWNERNGTDSRPNSSAVSLSSGTVNARHRIAHRPERNQRGLSCVGHLHPPNSILKFSAGGAKGSHASSPRVLITADVQVSAHRRSGRAHRLKV